MDRWSEPFRASYRFMRVSRATGLELGRIDGMLNGGSIERNQDTDEFESGTVDFVGDFDIGGDYVRCYLDASFWDGSAKSELLGTFLPSRPKASKNAGFSKGAVELHGLLHMGAKAAFEKPFIVSAGTPLLDAVQSVLKTCGLECVVEDQSDYVVGSQLVYGAIGGSDEAETPIAAANDLLAMAGFESCKTDVLGRVRLRRYAEPAARAAAHDFVEGIDARFLPDVDEEQDDFDVANVVIAEYQSGDISVRGIAVDDSPLSTYSTVNVGRRIAARYSYSDLPEGCTAERAQEIAAAKAEELLATKRSVIHRITFQHAYAPISVGDTIRFSYGRAGIDGKFAVRRQQITLSNACIVEEEARDFIR